MFELTLPYPNYFPTKPSQPTVHRSIPPPVATDLVPPKNSILLGQPETLGAAMPKAAVYKYRHLLFSK